ncbi:hypothetical protein F5Y11DRAFT_339947 [Daldinia sp. FL1419]|nr:hypothetical protein F5Y11DRAFT_339947 [Daldinia sp. FL1419]
MEINTHSVPRLHPSATQQPLPNSAPQVPAKIPFTKISSSAQTVAISSPNIRLRENDRDSSPISQPLDASISSLSPSQPSPPTAPLPTLPGSLEAQFQYLSIQNKLSGGTLPGSYTVSRPLQPSPEAYSTPPSTPLNDGYVPSLEGHTYESQKENRLKDKPVTSSTGLPKLSPSTVTSCIYDPVTFATDWYCDPDTPEFFVCSRCYVNHLCRSRFRDIFKKEKFNDGKPRVR